MDVIAVRRLYDACMHIQPVLTQVAAGVMVAGIGSPRNLLFLSYRKALEL